MNDTKVENAVDLGMDLVEEIPEAAQVGGNNKIVKGILIVTGTILVYEGVKWTIKKVRKAINDAKEKKATVVDFEVQTEEE